MLPRLCLCGQLRAKCPCCPHWKHAVGTHYCLAVGNDEGLELDETDEDEELGKVDEEEAEEYEGEDVRRIQSGEIGRAHV